MTKRLPPLNPLRAFEAAARHLSMSRAAAELNVTHGAISHQVRSLEKTLKVPLFVRSGNKFELSPHGAALLPSVTHAFGSIAEAVALLTAPSTEGDLVISCIPSLTTFWLLPRLNRFSERHPGVRLKLISSNDKRRIYARDVDIWVTYGNDSWPDRDVELWYAPMLYPVCSPALMNSKPVRELNDLRNHTLLHAYDGTDWSGWLEAAGAPELACGAGLLMSDAHLTTLAAIHGQGIALCDSLTGVDLLSEGHLVIPIDVRIPAPKAFYLVCRSELRRTPIVRTFMDWVLSETQSQVAAMSKPAAPAPRAKARNSRTAK